MIRGYRNKKPGEMKVLAKSKDLVDYTLQVTNSVKRFPKKLRFTLTNRLQEKSLEVHELLIEANEIYPSDSIDARERRTIQRKAVCNCKQLSFLVELCFNQGRIDEYQMSYWAGLINEVIKLTMSWQQSDSRRFGDL